MEGPESGDGCTYIFSGKSVRKDSPIVEAIGAVDELNSLLGAARSVTRDEGARGMIEELQRDLMTIGSDLANPSKRQARLGGSEGGKPREVDTGRIRRLGEMEGELRKEVPELRNFILPSGSQGAAALHMARAVARRAERRIVAAREEGVSGNVLEYFNRLSGVLFALARVVNRREGGGEAVWD